MILMNEDSNLSKAIRVLANTQYISLSQPNRANSRLTIHSEAVISEVPTIQVLKLNTIQ